MEALERVVTARALVVDLMHAHPTRVRVAVVTVSYRVVLVS